MAIKHGPIMWAKVSDTSLRKASLLFILVFGATFVWYGVQVTRLPVQISVSLLKDVASEISLRSDEERASTPRVILAYSDDSSRISIVDTIRRGRTVDFDEEDFISLEDEFEPRPKECVPMKEWQTKSFPTCNSIHELDIMNGLRRKVLAKLEPKPMSFETNILAKGGMRLAWSASINKSPWGTDKFIVKTLKWQRNYTEEIYEHNRIDALLSERLTKSPNIIDIYGFCGNSAINEMAISNGSLEYIVRHNITIEETLAYVTDAAIAIADVHSIDYSDDNSTAVHNDMGLRNFLMSKNGLMKLSDFNLSILQDWNVTSNKQCGFRHRHVCGVHGALASPESCKEEMLSEKIDVYGLGTIIFFALTKEYPYHYNLPSLKIGSDSDAEVTHMIQQGMTPKLPVFIEESKDPAIKCMVSVMRQAMVPDPNHRPTARILSNELVDCSTRRIQDKKKAAKKDKTS